MGSIKKEQGFTIWELLLILLLILLLLFGLWWVWQNNKAEPTDDSANQAQQNQEQAEQQPAQAKAEYLNITEWGVRFKLSNDNSGGYYYIGQAGPDYAYLSTDELKNTDCAANKTTTGVYTRFAKDDMHPIAEQPYLQLYPNAPKVGNYYFVFDRPQAYCSDDLTIRAKAEAAIEAFKSDVTSVEAIP
ncbi:MAG TPA: hypothetical protein VFB59_00135 [Candidatus Saccharimonadales bacterium]|nr:hypothetical protein [Candidatus Saccharimonadales bacterium]